MDGFLSLFEGETIVIHPNFSKKRKKKKKNVGLSEWPEFESKFSLKWASRSKIDGNCLFGLSEFTGHWPNKKDAKTT